MERGKRERPEGADAPSPAKLARGSSSRALATLATCSLNQWALDFDGNVARVIESIECAKAEGARYRLGPELELPGYGCEDHFYEQDTLLHSWQSLALVLAHAGTGGIVCDIGLPVLHKGVRYNARALVLDGRVLVVRPKMHLADDGNYREGRWFSPWCPSRGMEELQLPACVAAVRGQASAPIGFCALQFDDTSVGAETCEELFTPRAPHIALSLDGVEIIANGSGSHHELRKLDKRLSLLRSATAGSGGVYLYANQQGCDGGRCYYDGCALIVVNGAVVAQGTQFSLRDVEVVTATVDLEAVRSARAASASRGQQAARAPAVPRVRVPFALCAPPGAPGAPRLFASAPPLVPFVHCVEEEIAYGPACWLWDYLRRSGAAGFFLPLSGGADSAATAAIVGCMCQLVVRAIGDGSAPGPTHARGVAPRGADRCVLDDLRRIVRRPAGDGWAPASAAELAELLLHTCYMGTENSGAETRARAATLAGELGCYHLSCCIDPMVRGTLQVFATVCARPVRYATQGGGAAEDVALQNIQARLRMVYGYLLAQLAPWVRGREGFLLVLGSANVDEALRGYMTKYDCSAADINPIGGVSKVDLGRFLSWAATELGYASLRAVGEAAPTAELRPLSASGSVSQTDEEDMGMSYAELSRFGSLRKLGRCGPLAMFEALASEWAHRLAPAQVAEKVKRFFRFYAINRHKLTTLTPSYHAEAYSPEDNRFDLRPFLYPAAFSRQFGAIDELVAESSPALGAP